MKTYIKTAITALSLLALGLIASSCSDMSSGGTHEMGPPGKGRTMSDADMKNTSR